MIVAILDTAWGRGARWFRINPRNHSGRVLNRLVAPSPFVVTNACPDIVAHPGEHGTPDATWLRTNLSLIENRFLEGITLVLVCGRVATSVFEPSMVRAPVIHMDHPAARRWSEERILSTRIAIRRMDADQWSVSHP